MNTITPLTSTQGAVSINSKNANRRAFLGTNGVDKVEKIGNTNPNEKPVKMLLSLLRSSLSGEEIQQEAFKGANYHDWTTMLTIAHRSSTTGIAYDSLKKLPKGTVPTGISLKMAEYIREIEDKYARQEAVLTDLSKQYGEKGIETIALKGLGSSLNYPVPQHRHGRDIDIFTRFKNTVTEDRSNSTELVDDMMIEKGIQVEDYRVPKAKHSEFLYNDLVVENHKYFVNKEAMPEAKKIDAILHKVLNPVEKTLPSGTKILTPSKEFNTVFLAQHAFQHYAFGGIDLHNLVDWSMHIKQNGICFPEELKGTKVEEFANALTNVSNKYLGTNVEAPKNEAYEKRLFEKILHPDPVRPPENLSNYEIIMFKTKRFLNRFNETKELTGRSLSNAIIHSVKAHLRKPGTILGI